MKNKGLIILRVNHGLTQVEMAKVCNVSKSTYNFIENGKRRGSAEFWQRVKEYFKLDGEQMWKLQNPTM